MTKSAGYMTFLDVGVKVTDLATSNRINEILVVLASSSTGKLLYLLAVIVISPATGITCSEISAFTLNYYANTSVTIIIHQPFIFLTWQAANFKNQRSRLIVEKCYLRIGRLTVIFISQSAADAYYSRRQTFLTESPAG